MEIRRLRTVGSLRKRDEDRALDDIVDSFESCWKSNRSSDALAHPISFSDTNDSKNGGKFEAHYLEHPEEVTERIRLYRFVL